MAGRGNPLVTLRRFTRPASAEERCELCSVVLAGGHRHLLRMPKRQIVCACDPCALTFHDVDGGRFALIPRDARVLPEFRMTEGQWDSLALPINLVFFFHNSVSGKVTAMYPSPAGATESLLPMDTWQELVKDNPVLETMQPDVEALLINRVNRVNGSGAEHLHCIAPIDACYELVGLIRLHWRGLSGGEEVWKHIEAFFTRVGVSHA